jgi:hypothetical protein
MVSFGIRGLCTLVLPIVLEIIFYYTITKTSKGLVLRSIIILIKKYLLFYNKVSKSYYTNLFFNT